PRAPDGSRAPWPSTGPAVSRLAPGTLGPATRPTCVSAGLRGRDSRPCGGALVLFLVRAPAHPAVLDRPGRTPAAPRSDESAPRVRRSHAAGRRGVAPQEDARGGRERRERRPALDRRVRRAVGGVERDAVHHDRPERGLSRERATVLVGVMMDSIPLDATHSA